MLQRSEGCFVIGLSVGVEGVVVVVTNWLNVFFLIFNFWMLCCCYNTWSAIPHFSVSPRYSFLCSFIFVFNPRFVSPIHTFPHTRSTWYIPVCIFVEFLGLVFGRILLKVVWNMIPMLNFVPILLNLFDIRNTYKVTFTFRDLFNV